MSRKTLLTVLAVIEAILLFFKEQFGLQIEATAIVAGIGAVLVYVFFEARLDIERFRAQAGRFKDPKFWLAFIAALLAILNEQFGFNLPVETIIGFLTLVMGLLFGKQIKDLVA